MVEAGVIEFLLGLGRFFLNPSFYIVLLMVVVLGYRRTKRERKDFSIRIYPFNLEWGEFALSGVAAGLVISILLFAIGVVVPTGFIIATSLVTILLLLTMKPRLLSPAYVVGLAIISLLFLPKVTINNGYITEKLTDLTNSPFIFMGIILSVLLFAEGFLIVRKGHLHTSPKLKKSKRGKRIGLHEAKKLWLVPAFLLIPGDAITSMFEWWPVITTPFVTFSLIAVPFAIGFQQEVQASLPKEAIQHTGRRVLILAMIVTVLTIGAYWLPILVVAAAVIAVIGRELISIRQRMFDESHASYFSNHNKGLVILGVIPHSPAEKMALLVGESITKVNGTSVRTEAEFYEALQENRAFCKLEVLDYNGEVRFVQRALYDGEHHELGLLFVQDEKQWTNEAV